MAWLNATQNSSPKHVTTRVKTNIRRGGRSDTARPAREAGQARCHPKVISVAAMPMSGTSTAAMTMLVTERMITVRASMIR